MPVEVRFQVGDYASIGPFLLDRAIVVGRSTEADLSLPDNGLSRRHVSLMPADSGLRVRDLGSTNGTFYNGERVTEALVRCGEDFWIGHTRALVASAGSSAAPLPIEGLVAPVQAGHTPPPRQAFVPDSGEATLIAPNPLRAVSGKSDGSALPRTRPPFAAGGDSAAQPTPPPFQPSSSTMEWTRPPFEAVGAGAGRPVPKTSPHQAAAEAQRTAPPFPAARGTVAPTAPPFRAASDEPRPRTKPTAAVTGEGAHAEGLTVRVYVDGTPRTVHGLDLHFAENDEGGRFLQVVVHYDRSGDDDVASAWLHIAG